MQVLICAADVASEALVTCGCLEESSLTAAVKIQFNSMTGQRSLGKEWQTLKRGKEGYNKMHDGSRGVTYLDLLKGHQMLSRATLCSSQGKTNRKKCFNNAVTTCTIIVLHNSKHASGLFENEIVYSECKRMYRER